MVERNARRQGLLNSLSGLLSGWKVIALALVLCSLYFYCRVGEAQDGAHSDRTTATVYEGSHDRAAQVKASRSGARRAEGGRVQHRGRVAPVSNFDVSGSPDCRESASARPPSCDCGQSTCDRSQPHTVFHFNLRTCVHTSSSLLKQHAKARPTCAGFRMILVLAVFG